MGCGASSPAAVESPGLPGHRHNQNTTGPSSFNPPLNHVLEVLEVKEEPKNVSSMEVQTRVQGGGDLRQPTKAQTIIPKPEDISELAVRAAKREINNVVLSTVLHKEGTTDATSVIVQSSLDVQAAAAAQTEQMTDATSVIEQSSVDLQAAEAQAESAATSVIEQSSVDLKAAETQAESALEELQNGDISKQAEDVAEKLFSHCLSIVGSMDAVRRPVSIQDVQLPVYAKAEVVLNKYSVLGQVLVSVLQHAVSGLPFGAPVASLIGLIYSGAAQACQNTVEAKRLLKFIQQVDRFLAKQACAPGSIRNKDLKEALSQLPKVLQEAAVLLSAYSGRGFFKRFLLSSYDKGQFTRLTTEITDAMHIISFSVAMDNVGKAPTDTTEEEPDAAKLRCAMLKAANIPDDKVIWTSEKADEVINAISPDKLAELMRTYCKVEEKYILRELDALKVEFSQKMDAMQVEIYQEKAKLEKTSNEVAILKEQFHIMYIEMTKPALHEAVAVSRNLSPPALRPFFSKWWKDMFKLMQRVPNVLLMSTLSKWMVDSGHRDKLCEYDETLKNEGVVPASATAFVKIVGIVGSIFLRGVLLPLLDEDKDDYVSREDLLSCQLKADKFAADNDGISDVPTDWPSMMDVLYQGFDRIQHSGIIKSIIASHVIDPSMADNPLEIVEALLLQLEEKLKVKVIMESYNIANLLTEYVEGTRGWLYEDVNTWLEQALAAGPDTSVSSRAYLLISGPGMGKSVFSAVLHSRLISPSVKGPKLILVNHFFKVGELRAQASSMVLSLAYQLAEKLPGMMGLLTLVAQEHGTGTNLDLEDIFNNFLLRPLKKLQVDNPSLPVIVILLDALDEADYVGQGWMPVTRLVANMFPSLPTCVKLILTSRPQTNVSFNAWVPHIIEPKANENMEDVRKLLHARMKACEHVKPADITLAVQILERKSEGQLIYTKYAMDYLRLKPNWTLTELEMGLPQGLGGAYMLVLTILTTTLSRDNGNGPQLQKLLMEKVLPLLIAAPEPLSPQMLAWACGSSDSGCSQVDITAEANGLRDAGHHEKKYADGIRGQVDELLDLLFNIFPTRALPSTSSSVVSASYIIQPYHKSVLDWFLCQEGMDSGTFRVDVVAGHKILGAQLLNEALEASASMQLSDYCKKYAALHLCQSGSEASQRLDALLSHWDFLKAVIAAGHGGRLLSSLRTVANNEGLNPYSKDAYRWLARLLNYFEQSSQSLEELTVKANIRCPVGSFKFQEATMRLRWAWVPRLQLGGYGTNDWSPDISTLKGHSKNVTSVSFSPDGTQLATGSVDKTAKVWDLSSGTCTTTLKGHIDSVTSVSFSPKGELLATGSVDKTAKVWDLSSGTCTTTLEGHSDSVTSVSFSPNGELLATGSVDKTAKVWDLSSGTYTSTTTLKEHSDSVTSVSFNPYNGMQLATGSVDKTAKLWDVTNGTCTASLIEHNSIVTSVRFSPDGQKLATSSVDKTAMVWDLSKISSGTCTATNLLRHNDSVRCVSFSPDGQKLVTGVDDETAKVWDLRDGACIATLCGHISKVTSVSFSPISPDGKQLATASVDKTAKVWDLSSGACSAALQGHSAYVKCVCFSSPDGKQLASGGEDSTARIWDLSNGNCTAVLKEHSESVRCVSFSLDGKYLATGSDDSTAKVWDLRDGACIATLSEHRKSVTIVKFSLDGKHLATGSADNTAKIWDLRTHTCTANLNGLGNSVTCMSFSPYEKLLAIGSSYDSIAKVWDWSSGACTATLKGHSDPVKCVSFSPDGTQLATGSVDKTARVWEHGSSACIAILQGHSDYVNCLSFSPDGKLLVTGSNDKTARVWNISNSTCMTTLKDGHSKSVYSVTFSLDGKQLATGSEDKTVKVWNLNDRDTCTSTSDKCNINDSSFNVSPADRTNGTPLIAGSNDGTQLIAGSNDETVTTVWHLSTDTCVSNIKGHSNSVYTVTTMSFNPNGRYLVTCSADVTAKVWDLNSGTCTATLKGHIYYVRCVSFSPDGKQLATGSDDHCINMWDLDKGTCINTLKGHRYSVRCVSYSPNGKQLATGSNDKTAKVWEISSSTCIATLKKHDKSVTCVSFSPNGELLATGSNDKTVNVWNIRASSCISTLKGHSYFVTCVSFSPDGKQLATGSDDKTVKMWDYIGRDEGLCTATLPGHSNSVRCVSYSPDGKHLATGSDDKTAKVWDLGDRTCTATLQEHSKGVTNVSFISDGTQLASGSDDKTAKVWDLSSGSCTATLQGHHGILVTSFSLSPDGTHLATGSNDNVVKVWDLSRGTCTANLKGHGNNVTIVSFSPTNEMQLASGSDDKTAKIWDLRLGTFIANLREHSESVTTLSYSPDGKQLATGSDDNTAKVWDLSNGSCTANMRGHSNYVRIVCFNPKGKLLATGSDDNTAKVWDVRNGSCIANFLQGSYIHYVISLSFSLDGAQLATGSFSRAKVWDLSTNTCTADLTGHTDYIKRVYFSPDGKQLITDCDDETTKIWDISTVKCTDTKKTHSKYVRIESVSPDGKYLVTSKV